MQVCGQSVPIGEREPKIRFVPEKLRQQLPFLRHQTVTWSLCSPGYGIGASISVRRGMSRPCGDEPLMEQVSQELPQPHVHQLRSAIPPRCTIAHPLPPTQLLQCCHTRRRTPEQTNGSSTTSSGIGRRLDACAPVSGLAAFWVGCLPMRSWSVVDSQAHVSINPHRQCQILTSSV